MKRILSILIALLLFAGSQAQIGRYPFAKTPSSSTLLTGLISYWKFDESSGTLDDIHGANDGTNDGATYSITGKINTALGFTASETDYVNIGNPTNLQLTSAGSISCWAYTTGSTGSVILSKGTLANGLNGYILAFSSGKLTAIIGNASNAAQAESVATSTYNVYNHCVMTWNATTLTVYLNGVSASVEGLTAASSTYNLKIGADESGSFWANGAIDEIAIWNITLTAGQVAALYNSGSGKAYSTF
jgi:hypothetical protein